MGQSQKHPLRALSTQEERELQRVVKASGSMWCAEPKPW